ncbi:hypothetical protein [Pedobacter sp. B4-66]|uniref:hypothetical protein n=1 Tax=Pedobacter sp. B4-66 TaxID=2817280 RepID=UPI001BD98F77|nr:hypothetical protein [Pedobacter sp. B4-66]
MKDKTKELRKALNAQLTSGIEAVITGLDYNPKDAKKEINKAVAKLAKKLSKKHKVTKAETAEASVEPKETAAPAKKATAPVKKTEAQLKLKK